MRIRMHPILEFDRGQQLGFTFDGKPMIAYANETVAAALFSNGINIYRTSINLDRPRGFFCGIGRCASCSMIIDGVPNTRACVTRVREGMDVRTQHGRGDINDLR